MIGSKKKLYLCKKHKFEVERIGYDEKKYAYGKVKYIDFFCPNCSMRLFVKGKFSWHRGGDQNVLTFRDIVQK